MNKHLNKMFSVVTILALMLMALPAQSAQAAPPTELFFSEYIEGSSNNKALEIYNGTGAAVNLATDSYNIQMFFNGSATAGLTINLTGSVADGDVYVVAQASASATILAQADQTSAAGWFNGDDAVVLRRGTTVIDVIGQIGVDPGAEWGTGLTSTADNTLNRKNTVCGGDTNGSDAFDPAVEWDGSAIDTFGGLGAHTANCVGDIAPSVSSTNPANGATNVALNANITVDFSEAVDVTGSWFDITCATSGAHTAAASGGPNSFTLDPDSDFVGSESCTVTVFAAQVADQDTDDPPDNMAADFTSSFSTLAPACFASDTAIGAVQGTGNSNAISGSVTVQGTVIGDFEGPAPAIRGFYLQDAGDGNPDSSDGIFVFNGSNNSVSPGQVVQVTGTAGEFDSQTQLSGTLTIENCGSTSTVTPVDVSLPVPAPVGGVAYLERFEGMLVRFPQSLVISEYFNYDRFVEIVLAQPLPGESRPFTPTSIDEPGAPAQARALANSLSRITLDDASNAQNPTFTRHPNGGDFTLNNRFRGGDTVQNTVGVLGFGFSAYRIQPTAAAVYTAANPRPVAPDPVGGTLRVAAMNTLNFFITQDYPTGNPLDNKCGPAQNVECRGGDADQPTEFTRQRDKLLAALAGLNADVIGLNELENTTGVDPLGDPINGIVTGLNAMLGPGTYAYIDTGVIGTDAIRVGLIYKPSKVVPVGNFELLTSADDPRFIDTLSRPVLAQTFEELATAARFTVAVNHLKSKGSACPGDPDTGDGQGNCNLTRLAAAQALVDWLASDPTGSGDPDFLIMGDLNSYAKEDPIDAIKAGPDDTAGTGDDYTNLIEQYVGTYAYSFVFDGQSGYLDHALATPTMASQVTGATEWHINADEPDLIDYDTSFKSAAQDAIYAPDAYRSSDHDPVIVGLGLDINTMCNGLEATIVGTPGNDVINGTSGNDVIVGLGGNDIINGGNGDDVICGNAGNDTLNGGNGNDTLLGSFGNDTLNGNNGDDSLDGGADNDALAGNNGNDTLTGSTGADSFNGGSGSDTNTDFNAGEGDTSNGT